MKQSIIDQKEIKHQTIQFYMRQIQEEKPSPSVLNINLTSNPFLKDQDTFRHLKNQLVEYNKRIDRNIVTDPYQIMSYQRLHSMISDISQIQTRADQLIALAQIQDWFKEQNRLIQQRKAQGVIRYEITKLHRQLSRQQKQQKQKEVAEKLQDIPTYLLERIIEPFFRHYRTNHKDQEIASKRIKEYKRKVININNFIEGTEEKRLQRVLYPMPPKIEIIKEDPNSQTRHIVVQGQEVQLEEGQAIPIEDQIKDAVGGQNQQPDLGNFGEEPEQPEEEPQEETNDMLRPKNKIYNDKISEEKGEVQKQFFPIYKGIQNRPQMALELRYLKRFNDGVRKYKQDKMQIDIAHEWAKKKSRLTKQMEKRLQEMKIKPSYIYSQEPSLQEEKLNYQDEIRYGFTASARTRPNKNIFDLSLLDLPQVSNRNFQEKTLRKDRLNSLKNKFAKVLNIKTDREDRQSTPSICQYSSRRRGLSEIIKNHSSSKERLQQLEEVSKLKQKFTKFKISVNVKALSQGLCLPQEQQFGRDRDKIFPDKGLPSNPFMVEVKKKKKKK